MNTDHDSDVMDVSPETRTLPSGTVPTRSLGAGRPDEGEAIGARELRIVSAVENSFTSHGKYHIHVIKSRDISNARSFYSKVARILKLHGYTVRTLTAQDLTAPSLSGYNEKTTVLVMEENLFNASGEGNASFSFSSAFSAPSLVGINHLNVILLVSDAFYEKISPEVGKIMSVADSNSAGAVAGERSAGSMNYAAIGILMISLSFLLGAMSNFLPFYVLPSQYWGEFVLVAEVLMVLFTVLGIAFMTLSLGRADQPGQRGTVAALIFFIFLFGFAIFGSNSLAFKALVDRNHFLLFFLSLVFLAMFIAKFPLMIAPSRSRAGYALSIAGGLILSGFILFNTSLITYFIPGGAALVAHNILQAIRTIGTGIGTILLSSGFPAYGYISLSPVHIGFLNPVEYIPFAGNILIFAGYIVSYRRVRHQVAHKPAAVRSG
ncbi:MAG: hypothetical protein QXN26_05980 [Thermoplasmataceae archaeon]